MEVVLKYNRKNSISIIQFTNTIYCWFGVTGSHDMEDIKKAIILY